MCVLVTPAPSVHHLCFVGPRRRSQRTQEAPGDTAHGAAATGTPQGWDAQQQGQGWLAAPAGAHRLGGPRRARASRFNLLLSCFPNYLSSSDVHELCLSGWLLTNLAFCPGRTATQWQQHHHIQCPAPLCSCPTLPRHAARFAPLHHLPPLHHPQVPSTTTTTARRPPGPSPGSGRSRRRHRRVATACERRRRCSCRVMRTAARRGGAGAGTVGKSRGRSAAGVPERVGGSTWVGSRMPAAGWGRGGARGTCEGA